MNLTVPGLTGSQSISGDDHYSSIAFDIKGISGTYLDISQLQFELGTVPTIPLKRDKADVLRDCQTHYQRSYDESAATTSSTMFSDCVPDITPLKIPVYNTKDFYHTFPVKMRKSPGEVTLYSPESGMTNDGFNILACKDMRLSSGSPGPNNVFRVSETGADTIVVGNTAEHGIRLEILSGAVIDDVLSVHYVADADINKNL